MGKTKLTIGESDDCNRKLLLSLEIRINYMNQENTQIK